MSNKRRGQLTVTGEWAKHLRPLKRREFWKQERQAGKEVARAELPIASEMPNDRPALLTASPRKSR